MGLPASISVNYAVAKAEYSVRCEFRRIAAVMSISVGSFLSTKCLDGGPTLLGTISGVSLLFALSGCSLTLGFWMRTRRHR